MIPLHCITNTGVIYIGTTNDLIVQPSCMICI